jgi:S1-C subfamily serine protease
VLGSRAGEFTATPTDIKVLIGDDVEGVPADLVARDTELDLAWLRIKDPREEAYACIEFAEGASVEMGTPVVGIRRMGKYFGRIAVILEGRVGGVARKPRDLYVPTGDLASEFGIPVFTKSGQVVGMTVLQLPGAEDMESDASSKFGGLSGLQESAGGFILPAADVAKASCRALETVDAD